MALHQVTSCNMLDWYYPDGSLRSGTFLSLTQNRQEPLRLNISLVKGIRMQSQILLFVEKLIVYDKVTVFIFIDKIMSQIPINV